MPISGDKSSSSEDREAEEIERLADRIEELWDENTDPSLAALKVPGSGDRRGDVLLWVAGCLTIVPLTIYPLLYASPSGFVPAVFLAVAIALAVFAARRQSADRSVQVWGSVIGVSGLILMTFTSVLVGLNGATTPPGQAPTFGTLESLTVSATPFLWILGLSVLFSAWLFLRRKPASAFLAVPILFMSLVVVEFAISLVGSKVTPTGQLVTLFGPIITNDSGASIQYSVDSTLATFFVLGRAVEAAAVVFGALWLTELLQRRVTESQVKRREAALAQQTAMNAARVNQATQWSATWAEANPGQAMPEATPMQPNFVTGNRTNVLAVVALVFGLLASGIVPVVLGHIARSQIARSGERGAGMALAGLVLGYIWIAIGLALVIFRLTRG